MTAATWTAEELREAAKLAGQMYAARRAAVESVCLYCGQPITGTTRRRYCSPSHRVMAARRRQRADAKQAATSPVRPE